MMILKNIIFFKIDSRLFFHKIFLKNKHSYDQKKKNSSFGYDI